MKKLSMDELGRPSLEVYATLPKLKLVVVLDNVRSLMNVGSVFRSADAFGVERILLCGLTGTPPHREIQKTALGSTESVQWCYYPTTIEACKTLKAQGYTLALVEQTDCSIFLHTYTPVVSENGIAVVFGNEITGVSEDVLALADLALEIQQYGTKHSLNISVAAGIVLYDLANKLLSQPNQQKD